MPRSMSPGEATRVGSSTAAEGRPGERWMRTKGPSWRLKAPVDSDAPSARNSWMVSKVVTACQKEARRAWRAEALLALVRRAGFVDPVVKPLLQFPFRPGRRHRGERRLASAFITCRGKEQCR